MTQNCHNNLSKQLFNVFCYEKDRNLRSNFNILYFGFRSIMKWSEYLDTLLLREILVT